MTALIPSPSRTYVIKVFSTNFEQISFRKFILPDNIENTCEKATHYFYTQDLFSCGESAYPIEMHNNIKDMQTGFHFQY